MKEKSYFESIEDYAREKGIPHHSNKSADNHLLHPAERYTSKKFIIFELDKKEKNFFIFFDSYAPKAYTSNTFCGLFKKILKCDNEIKIIRRDWFDALSFKRRLKTGDYFLDRNVTIYSQNSKINGSIINNKVVREFIDLNKVIQPLELVTQREAISIVPELNGQSLVALKTNSWIADHTELTLFIKKGLNLFSNIR